MNDLLNTGILIKMKRFEMDSAASYRKGWQAYIKDGLSAIQSDNPFFNLGFAKAQEYFSHKGE